MKSLTKTLGKLRLADELDMYVGKVEQAEIESLMLATGCRLPEDYQQFLREFGFAFWDGDMVYGIYDDNDERFPGYNFSATTQTLRARKEYQDEPYPHFAESIVIGRDDMGGYFLLVSTNVKTDGRVLWVHQEETWTVTDSWKSFEDHLDSKLAE